MPISVDKKDRIGHLKITEEMTIYSAVELKEQLLVLLNECHGLEVDLSGVTELDSAGLQVLLLLKSEAIRHNKELRIANHSLVVIEVLELLNLVVRFGDPIVIPAEWGAR